MAKDKDDEPRPPTADELFHAQVRRVRTLLDDDGRKGRGHTPEARLQAEAMLAVALAIKCHSGAITGSGIATGLGSALGGLLSNLGRADGTDELGRKRPGPPFPDLLSGTIVGPGRYRATSDGSLICGGCRRMYGFRRGDAILVARGTPLGVELHIAGRQQLHPQGCVRSGYTGDVRSSLEPI